MQFREVVRLGADGVMSNPDILPQIAGRSDGNFSHAGSDVQPEASASLGRAPSLAGEKLSILRRWIDKMKTWKIYRVRGSIFMALCVVAFNVQAAVSGKHADILAFELSLMMAQQHFGSAWSMHCVGLS